MPSSIIEQLHRPDRHHGHIHPYPATVFPFQDAHEDSASTDEVTIQDVLNKNPPIPQPPLIPSDATPHLSQPMDYQSALARLSSTITFSIALLVLLLFAGYFVVLLLKQVLQESEDEDNDTVRTEIPRIQIIIASDRHPEKIEYLYGSNCGYAKAQAETNV